MEPNVIPLNRLAAKLDVTKVEQEPENDYIDLQRSFPYRPTLFLGFGGTGSRAVAKVKSLYEKVFANGKRGEGSREVIPSMYAFRAFDTSASEKQPGLEKNLEWIFLGIKDVRGLLEHRREDPFYRSWLSPNLNEVAVTNGCRGFRQLGRLAITANMDIFSKALDTAFRQILRGDPRVKVVDPIVYLFCSLAGGTGSGMLFDACFYLARNFPDAKRVGMIGLLEGLPTMATQPRQNAKIGAFAALKELNVFMTGNVPEECLVQGKSEFTYPIGEVTAAYNVPFHHCYILSSKNAFGQETLQTQEQLTSFMSRCVFAMSAYSSRSARADTPPDFTGIMNNREAELSSVRAGVMSCFIVPGLAQVHFPLEDIVSWCCCKIANDFLRHIKEGTSYEGDDDARRFVESNQLGVNALTEAVTRDENGSVLNPRRYDEEIKKRLANRKIRYSQQGKELLSLGDAMPTRRLAEREADMRPAAELIINRTKAALWKTISIMLKEDRFLYLGAQDFLQDLKNLLGVQLETLRRADEEQTGLIYNDIARNWGTLRTLVQNVVSKGHVLDRFMDDMNRGKCETHLTAFLNQAELTVFERARNNATAYVLSSLLEEIESARQKLKSLYEHSIAGAVEILEEKRNAIASDLLLQERGQGESPENICSINIITQEVREKILKNHQDELSPKALLNTLSRRDWNPLNWLEFKPEALKGVTLPRLIANNLLQEQIAPLLDSWLNWDIGQMLGEAKQLRGMEPDQYLAEQLYSGAQSQMVINQKNILSFDPDPSFLIGGINDHLKEELVKSERFAPIKERLNSAESHEKNRITIFAAHLPVAAAGLTDVKTVFKRAYDDWLKNTAHTSKALRESTVGLFHCFPNSVNWPDPTVVYTGAVDVVTTQFAKALLISEILKPDKTDLELMERQAKAPNEKRYALFRVGQANFWLWPFFEPYKHSPFEQLPVNLGTNIGLAHRKFKETSDCREAAQKWIEWYENHWIDFFRSDEARAAHSAAQRGLPTTGDEEGKRLWQQIQKALEDWKAQLYRAEPGRGDIGLRQAA